MTTYRVHVAPLHHRRWKNVCTSSSFFLSFFLPLSVPPFPTTTPVPAMVRLMVAEQMTTTTTTAATTQRRPHRLLYITKKRLFYCVPFSIKHPPIQHRLLLPLLCTHKERAGFIILETPSDLLLSPPLTTVGSLWFLLTKGGGDTFIATSLWWRRPGRRFMYEETLIVYQYFSIE